MAMAAVQITQWFDSFVSMPLQEAILKSIFDAYRTAHYQEIIKAKLGPTLIDPYSAVYRFSRQGKYVSAGKFGEFVLVGLNAKNRFGGYVGEVEMHFMCFNDGIRQINVFATGFASGLTRRSTIFILLVPSPRTSDIALTGDRFVWLVRRWLAGDCLDARRLEVPPCKY